MQVAPGVRYGSSYAGPVLVLGGNGLSAAMEASNASTSLLGVHGQQTHKIAQEYRNAIPEASIRADKSSGWKPVWMVQFESNQEKENP